ncbi:hypothetical protein NVP1031O_115 [Vibrio phage 1.031.O._10N.261.46.F8]|nr:hypothetical protein NVP1031O_115 [Vibrio phage 1.031.O._10N.261.46.F8]
MSTIKTINIVNELYDNKVSDNWNNLHHRIKLYFEWMINDIKDRRNVHHFGCLQIRRDVRDGRLTTLAIELSDGLPPYDTAWYAEVGEYIRDSLLNNNKVVLPNVATIEKKKDGSISVTLSKHMRDYLNKVK